MPRRKLGEMLVEAGVLTEQSLRMALSEQRRWGGPIGRILVEMKVLAEADLVDALSTQLNLPTIDLDHLEIHPTVLELVPGELAEQHNLVPFAQPMKFLDVAMTEPTNLGVLDELRIRTQLNIRPYLAGPKMIERALAKHYRRGSRGFPVRRDIDVSSEMTGDGIALAPRTVETRGSRESLGDGPAERSRPATAEIDAARRREGLRPAPRPSRPPPLEMPTMPMMPAAHEGPAGPPSIGTRDAEIDALQDRLSRLEALVERDEEVLRKLLALLVEKGLATREEILERIR